MKQRSRLIRVFLSSTFRDFQGEREVLQNRVVPAIRARYARHGVAFELVDLRWGIPPAATRSHRTLNLCLREIERCATLSPRCHFLFMLGDRYGWRPAPVVIADEDYELLASEQQVREALRAWYRHDTNAVPPIWRLRPSTADDESWDVAEQRLVTMLETAAVLAGVANPARFGASVTEMEIRTALGCCAAHPASITGVFRSISNAGTGGHDFLDSYADRRHCLRADLGERLQDEAIIRFTPTLSDVTGPSEYLDTFAAMVEQRLSRGIEDELSARESFGEDEATLHEGFRLKQRDMVKDRLEIIAEIAAHAEPGTMSAATGPLIVAGPSGIGKTTAMAAACEAIRRRLPDAYIIYRAVGSTSESTMPLLLLSDICGEIARLNGRPAPGVFIDDEEAADKFLTEIRLWSGPQLVIMVDALDQLQKSSPAHQYNWIPATLPGNVRMVLSAIMDLMPDHLWKRAGKILELPYLLPDEAGRILDEWLSKAGRTLQPRQRELALQAFSQVGLPLYLRLLIEFVRDWSSDEDPAPPPPVLDGIIDALLDRLSDPDRSHIPELAQRVFGFLAVSRHGLSYDEMQGVLSLEADLIASVTRHWSVPQETGGLPAILWSRLYHDLRPLLAERLVDGTVVLSIFHSSIERRMVGRLSLSERRRFASALADYFSTQPLIGEDGHIISQRPLSERPYLLEQAGRIDDLRECLLDHSFLDAKVQTGGVYDLIHDFERLPPDDEAAAVGGALRLSAHVLERNPAQLSGQLRARIDSSSPLCRRIFEPATRTRRVELRPQQAFLASPGGCLANIIRVGEDNWSRPVFPVGAGPLVVVADDNNTISVWDLDSGCRVRRIAPPPGVQRWRPVAITPDGRTVVTARDNWRLALVDLERGEVIDHVDGEGPAAVSGGGRFLFHASLLNHVCVYDLDARQPVRRMGPMAATIRGITASHDGRWVVSWTRDFDTDQSPMVWDNASGQPAGVLKGDFYARSSENIFPHHHVRVKHHALFKGHESDVQTITFTRDARLIISSGKEGAIVVWDRETREQIKKLVSPSGNMVGAHLLPDGRRVVSVETGGALRVWDIETDQRLLDITGDFSEVYRTAIISDGHRIIASRHDGQLHVWHLDKGADGGEILSDGSGQLTLTPDGRFAVRWRNVAENAFTPQANLAIIDMETGRHLLDMDVPVSSAETVCAAATPDGRYLVRTSERGIYAFDLFEKKLLKQHSIPHNGAGGNPLLSRDGLFGLSEESPGHFTIVDALSGKAIHKVSQSRAASFPHSDRPFNLIDGGAAHLVQLRKGEPAEIYDTSSGSMIYLDVDSGPDPKAVVLPDGVRVLSTGTQNCLVLWTTRRPAVLKQIGAADRYVLAMAVSNGGGRALTVHDDKSVRLWDLESATLLARLDINQSITDCAFIDGDRAAALGDGRRLIRINIVEVGE